MLTAGSTWKRVLPGTGRFQVLLETRGQWELQWVEGGNLGTVGGDGGHGWRVKGLGEEMWGGYKG